MSDRAKRNNTFLLIRQCRQEIEDCIRGVILKHQKPDHEKKKTSFHMKPQVLIYCVWCFMINTVYFCPPSTTKKKKKHFLLFIKHSVLAMEEDPQKTSSSSVRTTTEAFKVSV